jgi:hypothetical protein
MHIVTPRVRDTQSPKYFALSVELPIDGLSPQRLLSAFMIGAAKARMVGNIDQRCFGNLCDSLSTIKDRL